MGKRNKKFAYKNGKTNTKGDDAEKVEGDDADTWEKMHEILWGAKESRARKNDSKENKEGIRKSGGRTDA